MSPEVESMAHTLSSSISPSKNATPVPWQPIVQLAPEKASLFGQTLVAPWVREPVASPVKGWPFT